MDKDLLSLVLYFLFNKLVLIMGGFSGYWLFDNCTLCCFILYWCAKRVHLKYAGFNEEKVKNITEQA